MVWHDHCAGPHNLVTTIQWKWTFKKLFSGLKHLSCMSDRRKHECAFCPVFILAWRRPSLIWTLTHRPIVCLFSNFPDTTRTQEKELKYITAPLFSRTEQGRVPLIPKCCELIFLKEISQIIKGPISSIVLQSTGSAHRTYKHLTSAVVISCTGINSLKIPVYQSELLLRDAFLRNVETKARISWQLYVWHWVRICHNTANLPYSRTDLWPAGSSAETGKPCKEVAREEVPHSTSERCKCLMTGSADYLPPLFAVAPWLLQERISNVLQW